MEGEEGEACLEFDETEILAEISLDEEDLPDADDDLDDEAESCMDHDDDSTHIFTRHTGEVYSVACSPVDPKLVATGDGDNSGPKGFLWKVGEEQITQLSGHTDSISSLAFSFDGQLIASGGLDSRVKIWDTMGNLKWDFEGHPVTLEDEEDAPRSGFEWVKWHPKDHRVLAGSNDSHVWMWDADSGACLNVLSGHSGRVLYGDFTPDGNAICTASDDGTLRIWDVKSSQSKLAVGGGGYVYHNAPISSLELSADSKLAFTGALNGSVCIVNIRTGKVVGCLSGDSGHSDSVECIGLAPSMPWAATGSLDTTLIIWDLQHSSARMKLQHKAGVGCLVWLGGSRYLATGCDDGKTYIWDSRCEQPVKTYRQHSDKIMSLSVTCNQDLLVTASYDGTARVFDMSQFK